jgi:hypothetical protein
VFEVKGAAPYGVAILVGEDAYKAIEVLHKFAIETDALSAFGASRGGDNPALAAYRMRANFGARRNRFRHYVATFSGTRRDPLQTPQS